MELTYNKTRLLIGAINNSCGEPRSLRFLAHAALFFDVPSVVNTLKRLEASGLVIVDRSGTTNCYELTKDETILLTWAKYFSHPTY